MTLARITPILRKDDLFLSNLSYELGIPSNKLSPYTRLFEDLLLDQLDTQLLIASLERQFNYFLTEEEAEHIQTVGDLQRFFARPHAA
ncbi:MAG: hypothetical protein AAGF87_12610 [Bacteroidota bacterium]